MVDRIWEDARNYLGHNPQGWQLLARYGDEAEFPTWVGNTRLTIMSASKGDHWASVRIVPNVLGMGLSAEVHNVGGSQPGHPVKSSIVRNWGGMKIKVVNYRTPDGNTHFPVFVKTE